MTEGGINMKRIIILFIVLCCVWRVSAQTAEWEFDKMAVREAVGKSESSLKNATFDKKLPIALLPLKGDVNGEVAAALKTLLTNVGFNCVEGKEDPMWDEIIREVEWDERKDDILDERTIVRFGRLQAAKILIYGGIRTIDRNENRVYAEIDLHATNLTTKQHIWGGTFASRVYFGLNVNGIISLDVNLKNLLKKNFNEARDSMQQPAAATRLASIRSVAVVPLVGDIDQYMTGLAVDMLTGTNHPTKTPLVPSLLETRVAVRNHSLPCDAVFYGYIRDLSRTPFVFRQLPKEEKVEAVCTYHADIQLFLEDAASGSVLWSKTVTMAEEYREERDMSNDELRKVLTEQDERNTFKRVLLDKAEKDGTFRQAEQEMHAGVVAARTALAAGRYAETLIHAEGVLNRADDDETAAKWKKEALTLKQSAEVKLKAYNIAQIDKEIEEAVKTAREAKKNGKWDDVRLNAEAALRIVGGSETANKWRIEAKSLLEEARKWKADQALSKVDTEIEGLVKTARAAMAARRLDEALIYAKMALRMKGGTAKAEQLRSEAAKLVTDIESDVVGLKNERVDKEMKGMVEAARNAMQHKDRLGEALVYVKIATAIDGGSEVAEKLRNEATKLAIDIADMIGNVEIDDVLKEVRGFISKAYDSYHGGKLEDALVYSESAMNVKGASTTADWLKTVAASLHQRIEWAIQDREITNAFMKAKELFDKDDLDKALGYARQAAGMIAHSAMATNQKAGAEALVKTIEEKKIAIETGENGKTFMELVKTVSIVALCIVGVVALLILAKMWMSSKNIR